MTADFRFFDAGSCEACGSCLDRCRYIDLSGKEAIKARRQIREGNIHPKILSDCVSCLACNSFCPNNLKPYESILEFWYQRYKDKGLPERARFMLPTAKPNFRTHIISGMPDDEKKAVSSWAEEPKKMTGTVLYPGCNLITLPFLLNNNLLEGITIQGSLDLCCGEMYYRMGLFDKVDQIAKELSEFYAKHAIDELLFACPACYNMFTNILPKQFGASFSFKTRFITELLIDKLENVPSGIKLAGENSLVVHDSCQARAMGSDFLQNQRRLLDILGVRWIDPEDDLMQGQCCGIAGGCARMNPLDIMSVAMKALSVSKKKKADRILTYCGGCYLVLSIFRLLNPTATPVDHVLELANKAIGAHPEHRIGQRSRRALGGVLLHGMPKILSFNRFRI